MEPRPCNASHIPTSRPHSHITHMAVTIVT